MCSHALGRAIVVESTVGALLGSRSWLGWLLMEGIEEANARELRIQNSVLERVLRVTDSVPSVVDGEQFQGLLGPQSRLAAKLEQNPQLLPPCPLKAFHTQRDVAQGCWLALGMQGSEAWREPRGWAETHLCPGL